MDTPIYIYPIWRTTYYALDEDVDTVMYRIVAEDGEVIFTGRARKRPDEEYIFINLNKPCQNHIDSIITPGLGVRRSNGYRAFTLQFKFDGNDAGWDTWHEFAFYNDWSYEERSNGDDAPASANQSEPINGHAAPGMYIPSTYVITGASEEICYEEVEPVPPVPQGYLTFEILSAGTINYYRQYDHVPAANIYYSKDRGATWTELNTETIMDVQSFDVEAGDEVWFKGNNTSYAYNHFSGSTAEFNIKGNIMSLVYGDDFEGETEFPEGTTFQMLFERTKVRNAEDLIIPSTSVGNHCFYMTFYQCWLLQTAPELPATTLGTGCYYSMFERCGSLVSAPELPATTLAEACYRSMFSGCYSLENAPELPASTLQEECYYTILSGCSMIDTVTCLATDISAYQCTAGWLNGVAANGTFIKSADMESWSEGVTGIPSGWTVIDYSN